MEAETRRATTVAPQPRAAPPAGPPRGAAGRTRLALVGAGFIAEVHLEVLAEDPGVEVVALCDPHLERAQRLARRHRVPHAVERLAELPALGVEVAHVLAPPELHAGLARELLERGIGVFVEKPLALSSAEARELTLLAADRGLPLGVNHNALFHPAFARLLARVRRGELGTVEHVQATLSVPLRQLDAGDYSHWMFRRPRNIVFEQAAHPFSQLVELVGPVKELRASVLGTRELHPGQAFHDRWLLAARAERGTAEVYLAFGQPFTRSEIRVLGTDGAAEADLHHALFALERKTPWLDSWNSFLAGWRRGGMLRRGAARGFLRWVLQTLGWGRREDAFYSGMRASIRAFHAALRAGTPPPVGGRQGEAVLAWCEAAVAELPDPPAPAPLPWSAGPARAGEVAVLGAGGFIGRRVVARLRARGLPVTAVTRRNHALPPELAAGVEAGAVRLVRAELDDPAALRAAVRGARVVLHLATGGGDTWEAVERSMVHGTLALAQAAQEAGVERLVFVSSTAALYLGADAGPSVSDATGPDPRPEARAPYARGKVLAERELLRLHASAGLPVTIVRPAVVVGEGSPFQHSGIGLWVRDNHCVGWGLGRRPVPLVHVDDVADALVELVLRPGRDLDGRALNLASRSRLTAPEIVAQLAEATGRDLSFHPRPLWLSQLLELGKWVVKRVGGRRDAAFPSYRDLKSRELAPELRCETARDVLAWRPCDDGREILRRALRRPAP